MEKFTIKSMIKTMDGTYAGMISETLMDEIKLVNKMVKLNDCYATPYTERRAA